MSNYTMTFYCKECLTVPQQLRMRQKEVCGQVREKLIEHKLELIDFNLTENYNLYPASHKKSATLRTIVEIRLELSRNDLRSREDIYNRCLYALMHDEVTLSSDTVFDADAPEPQLLVFDRKPHAAA